MAETPHGVDLLCADGLKSVTIVLSCICGAVPSICHAHSGQDCGQCGLSHVPHTAYTIKYRTLVVHLGSLLLPAVMH